jgi:two-component system nitrogen regulation response regulator NtrX
MKKEILVIDDNADIRFLICNLLKDNGFSIRAAANYDQALYEIDTKLPDLAIVDIKLDKGDKDGIDLLKHLMKLNSQLPVLMISGHATVQLAVEAIRLGAYEFIEKPFSVEKILNYVKRAFETFELKDEKQNLEQKLFHSFDLVGNSGEIVKIQKLIEKLKNSESRILITGPTGSGKELVARKIHKNSQRANKPFIVLNAALLQPNKYEKELFGEEFDNGKISYGVLDRSNNGTLLLDEISEIPLEIQSHILRVLIDQKYRRVNGKDYNRANIRIIASSSKNLNEMIKLGEFREDLYHRLNVVPIELPSLVNRYEDIPLLIKYFKKKIAEINNLKEANIEPDNQLFYDYEWPGNIRELRNMIERVTILGSSESTENINKIIKDIMSKNENQISNQIDLKKTMSSSLKEARDSFEKNYLLAQLKRNSGNISKTADLIGMERSALHRKLKSLGIKGIN